MAKNHPEDLAVADKMGRSGLEVAAYLSLGHAVSHLVNVHGFDVRTSGKSGMTALHWAALEGRVFLIYFWTQKLSNISDKIILLEKKCTGLKIGFVLLHPLHP